MKLSFVVPCYGSANTLAAVVKEIREAVAERYAGVAYEIILVNDCSPDGVGAVIERLCDEFDNVVGIELAKNFGQHAALLAGYRHSTGDIVISLDDDGQTPAAEAFRLIEKIREGHDVVFGVYPERKHGLFRRIGTRLNDAMAQYLIKKPVGLRPTSFWAGKRFLIDEICRYENSYPYILGLVLRSTRNIAAVPVEHRDRSAGQSGYTFGKLLSLWLNGFTAFSVRPLRLASLLGLGFAMGGFLYGLHIVVRKLLNADIPMGYSSMLVTSLILGGLILMTLGLIGEYIGRIYISLNNSPQSVIRRTISRPRADAE